jgi:Arc/MetJ-type ribon-helix-helix transcriptional regulator
MGRQLETPPKKRGPPATGKGEPILVRLQPAQLAALDAWMGRQDARLSRPEAIRRLLEQALAVEQPAKSRTQKARSKALGLASTQLDRLLDPSAPDEERQRRKRRLLKGPKEFRELRDAVHAKSKR